MSRGRVATSTRAGIAKPRPDEMIRSMSLMVGEIDSGRETSITATQSPNADKTKIQMRSHVRRVVSVKVSARSVHEGLSGDCSSACSSASCSRACSRACSSACSSALSSFDCCCDGWEEEPDLVSSVIALAACERSRPTSAAPRGSPKSLLRSTHPGPFVLLLPRLCAMDCPAVG